MSDATTEYFKDEPDWAALRALDAELQQLKADGKWDKDAFEDLMKRGKPLTNGHPEFLEAIVNEADSAWI